MRFARVPPVPLTTTTTTTITTSRTEKGPNFINQNFAKRALIDKQFLESQSGGGTGGAGRHRVPLNARFDPNGLCAERMRSKVGGAFPWLEPFHRQCRQNISLPITSGRGEYPYCARLRKCAHAIISKTIVYRQFRCIYISSATPFHHIYIRNHDANVTTLM